jgi:signal transduction histidine kinase
MKAPLLERLLWGLALITLTVNSCDISTVDRLYSEISSIPIQGADSIAEYTKVSTQLRELRSSVFDANDPHLDSLYNLVVTTLLGKINTTESALVLECFRTAIDINESYLRRKSPNCDKGELAHAFRSCGLYDKARSLYTSWTPPDAAESRANRLANLSMEYNRAGYTEDALAFAMTADSLFTLAGDHIGQLWTKRLVIASCINSDPDLAIEYQVGFRQLLQKLHFDTTADFAQLDNDVSVSVLSMYHALTIRDTTDNSTRRAFGKYYNYFSKVYLQLANSGRHIWATHTHKDFRDIIDLIPRPIIRAHHSSDGDIPLISYGVGSGADSARTVRTPIGNFIRVGKHWRHDGTVQHGAQSKSESISTVILRLPFTVRGFLQTADDTLITCSEQSIYRHVRRDGRYNSSAIIRTHSKIIEGSLCKFRPDVLAVLTEETLLFFDLVTMNQLATVSLQRHCHANTPIIFPRISNQAGIYPLSDSLLFIVSRHGTLALKWNRAGHYASIVPHVAIASLSYGVNRYQVVNTGIGSLSATFRDDTVVITDGGNYIRSWQIDGGVRLRLTQTSKENVEAFVSGDRIDVVDRDAQRCFSLINLPLPYESANSHPSIYYHLERCLDTLKLEYSYKNTIRSIQATATPATIHPRYYVEEGDNTSYVRQIESPPSTVSVSRFPCTIFFEANTVASRIAAQIVNHDEVSDHIIGTLERDGIFSFGVTSGSHSFDILNPLSAHSDVIKIQEDHFTAVTESIVEVLPGITLVLLCFGGYMLVLERNRRHRRQIEHAKTEQLELLREDMHDIIGSRLVRIASIARQSSPDRHQEALSRIHDMTLVTVRSLRNLLTLMSETSMTDAGFYGSLREYVSESTNDAGLHCTVEIEIDSLERTSMDGTSRHELLMIVSELLTNTLRHSQARCVHFTVDARGSQTTITWSDDGVGLDPAAKRGNGLNNIQRRATRIGATVSVDSDPDNGTRFTITYPTLRG